MNILADFHHSTLLNSLYLTFERRLGHKVYRPLGMEWFDNGYWAVNDQRDTAEQYLGMWQIPGDGTPPLNNVVKASEEGIYYCGTSEEANRGITLEAFKGIRFDILIASLPQHVPIFRELIRLYQPQAKLILQVGNNWNIESVGALNILASVAPRPTDANVMFYHQEFDTAIFRPQPFTGGKQVYSFINILQDKPVGWSDFEKLETALAPFGVKLASYGGQCRDGNIEGASALADKMAEADMIFHVKDGGDGYGHIIHNAYAVGRPVITRSSFYKGQLAADLLIPGTFIDLDDAGRTPFDIGSTVMRRDVLEQMGQKAAARFREVVDFNKEGDDIAAWLMSLR